eukprot:24283-Prorocentrum_minimum.AAC.2
MLITVHTSNETSHALNRTNERARNTDLHFYSVQCGRSVMSVYQRVYKRGLLSGTPPPVQKIKIYRRFLYNSTGVSFRGPRNFCQICRRPKVATPATEGRHSLR